MEDKKEFKEGIESYRKRIINELSFMNSNIDGFVDTRNMKFELKHLVQSYRRSLEKCNLYLSEIEVLINGSRDDTNTVEITERTSISRGENL